MVVLLNQRPLSSERLVEVAACHSQTIMLVAESS
jgi:hypothetical protein